MRILWLAHHNSEIYWRTGEEKEQKKKEKRKKQPKKERTMEVKRIAEEWEI